MTDHLLVFTRYPQPGHTKTRLIPALGAEGAAKLQQQLTEHTLTKVRSLQAKFPQLTVTIHYSNADLTLIRSWLGPDWVYSPQIAGDLGQRMQEAFRQAFEGNSQRVVIIGIDCPELSVLDLIQAFASLHDYDLVIGPATDGGYYLLGLRQLRPALFHQITWGSDQVLSQSLAIAASLKLRVKQLRPLTDIDRPGDLTLWEGVRGDA